MSIKRRDFFKLAAAGAVTLSTGSALASDDEYPIDCGEVYSVLVDTRVCIGCRKCELACDQEHTQSGRSAASFEDKTVFEKHRRPGTKAYTVVNRYADPANPATSFMMKAQCMHCNYPACVSACIVGALQKMPLGAVTYDAWKCIGCRYCIVACPFQIPTYEYDNPLDPEVRKCTFCHERVATEGRRPVCVTVCPTEALTFGTRHEMLDIARARIKALPDKYVDHVYGEHEVGGTSWMYLSPIDFKFSELPELPSDPLPPKTETIQHGIFKWFVPPLALYGLLGLIMHSLRDEHNQQEVPR
ncbi:MAG TPA: 4Fe-4S dicluster domain-containing protein [Acidobacteriota bacterium]|nr:4Fe-4S dicluster domain-containing protein [Acidobacteriota bacterium]